MIRRAAFGAVAMLAAGTGLAAPQDRPVRSGITLTRIDVSVLDRDRRPVRGLTKEAFSIREDGKLQAIEFSEVHLDRLDEQTATGWQAEVGPDVGDNEDVANRRLIVIVLDDAMMALGTYTLNTAKEAARAVVSGLGPNDRAAVVFTLDRRHVQNFTADRARLLAAIDTLTFGHHDPLQLVTPGLQARNFEIARGMAPIRTLHAVIRALGSIPDRRKSVIYISIGVPLDVSGIHPGQGPADPTPTLYRHLQEVFRDALAGNINIYTVDPGGFDSLRIHLQTAAPDTPHDLARREFQESVRTWSTAYRDYLKIVAENTGGLAFTDANDVPKRMGEILRDTGSFYLLGYQSTNPKADGRFRRVQVRVNKPRMNVRARSGYFAAAADAPPLPGPDEAVMGILPRADVPLRLLATPFGPVAGSGSAGAVQLGLSARGQPEAYRVLLVAYDLDGQVVHSERLAVEGVAPTDGEVAYEVLGEIPLPPGRYEIRASAERVSDSATGSVYADLEIPDYDSARFALSGPALSVVPAGPAGPEGRFAGLMPRRPTLRRVFGANEEVKGFVRLHQGGPGPARPAQVTIRLLDRAGSTVFDLPREFASVNFGEGRRADYEFDLPLDRLAPGPHLLVVEARSGDVTIVRRIRFERR